jgi:hypothetical protein
VKRFICLILVLGLTGCGTKPLVRPEPIIQTVEVKTPVIIPCDGLKAIGPDPVYPDTADAIKAAEDLFTRVKLLLSGREFRITREQAYKDALKACK